MKIFRFIIIIIHCIQKYCSTFKDDALIFCFFFSRFAFDKIYMKFFLIKGRLKYIQIINLFLVDYLNEDIKKK